MFSGIGGLCEGIKLAGFRITGANERDPFAVESYKHNFPTTPLFEGDVADLFAGSDPATCARHLEHYVGDNHVDVVFGGPPCQGYSQIGPRDVGDPRNEMYLHVCRVAELLRPKYILIENVPNMLLMKNGLFKKRISNALRRIGYDNISIRVVDASEYGVPQKRRRVFFLATKRSYLHCDIDDIFDVTLQSLKRPLVTVDEAISDLPAEVAVDSSHVLPYPKTKRPTSFQKEMRLDCDGDFYKSSEKMTSGGVKKVSGLFSHHTKDIQERRLALIKLLKPGMKADSLPKEVWDNARPEKWRRFHPDLPAHTLLAQMHRDLSEWVHPHHDRWITVREAQRLQGFHDGFVLKSSEWQQLKQVGNAVPPMLAYVPAMAIRLAESVVAQTTPPFSPRGQLSLFQFGSKLPA
jgi:DNA (cytosine-5)-methyltransferase 1